MSRTTVSGNAARICAQNFEAVLAMIVKFAGEARFTFFVPGCIKTHSKTPTKYTYYSLGLRAGGWGGGWEFNEDAMGMGGLG